MKEFAENKALLAIGLALCGYFTFSIVDVAAKYLGAIYNVHLILFIANFIGFVVLCGFILIHKGPRAIIPRQRFDLHLFRAALMVANSYFIVAGLTYISIADMYGLLFASPFIMTILSIFILKETVGLHRWVSIIVGFIGVLIILQPGYSTMNLGMLFGVCAALVLGMNAIVIRMIGSGEYTPIFPFYAMLAVTLFNAPFALMDFVMPPLAHLAIFAVYGVGIVIAIGLIARAYVTAPTTATIAPFVYSSMIWAVLFGYLIFDDIPKITTYIGAAVIMSAGFYLLYREQQAKKSART
jgi:drug/metabolite transporter (DMT)-like permease